ncbi:shikimate dehydrogenase family protein [Caballeronia insecticola]|uniref:shikimate dehydrogenase (NADP(+)) n=1 Tax=Caballeronia insecticola TaxID=758793 RepID=R4X1E9_9BURK|nr:shikimate dehydrogenase [Caballeronia insecticola]BAN28180.1 shikimate/quinate 5-dehydrogenase family protein 2 [Caballeronia insecticola]
MEVDGATRIVGIIADPIGHVRTPQMFNAAAARQGVNAICIPFHVQPEKLREFIRSAGSLKNLNGLVVTIPYKEAVLELCDELTATAGLVGAVNAMRLNPETGSWTGGNFDGAGFVAGLRARGHILAGRRVLLLGAGGAGKAMAFSIARERPAELVIFNRSSSKAQELVERLRAAMPDILIRAGGNDPAGFEIVVNATSLGLRETDALPVSGVSRLDTRALVCEAVVGDGETRLLREARQHGCEIHRGIEMLSGQIVEIASFFGISFSDALLKR